MPSLLELREQVRQILTSEFNGVGVDEDGDFNIQNESTRVFIRCIEQDLGEAGSRTIVSVFAPVIFQAPPSPELFEYVALEADSFMFGHLHAVRSEDGSVSVMMDHRMLGDYLDSAELTEVVYGVAFSANRLDDEMKARFGGHRLHES